MVLTGVLSAHTVARCSVTYNNFAECFFFSKLYAVTLFGLGWLTPITQLMSTFTQNCVDSKPDAKVFRMYPGIGNRARGKLPYEQFKLRMVYTHVKYHLEGSAELLFTLSSIVK